MKAKVLGTDYEIISVEETNDNLEKYPSLKECSGYTDITTKQIYILKYKNTEDTFINLDILYKKTLRHELIHAFLYESGLFNNTNNDWARNEEVVDWIAIQFEKILGVFIELQCIDSIGVDINIFDRQSNDPINDSINSPIKINLNNLAKGEIIGGDG